MQELEKILEEIDKATDEYGMVDYINDEPVISKNQAKEIIRKHMNDNSLRAECSRRQWYQIGYKDGKNDGWIPVEKFGLPKSNEHDFMFWITIQYVNGFRRTIKAKWDWYDKCFTYQNGKKISQDVIAYKYYSAPEPYRSERSDNHDGE